MVSSAFEMDWKYATKEKPRPVFTPFADKTMLVKSGAMDGLVVRIRVGNLKVGNTRWYDVGYAPILSQLLSHAKKQVLEARVELF